MKLEHIGIAVKEIDKRLAVWRDALGFELLYIKDLPDQQVKVAVFNCGDVHIELLEALDEESPVHRFIEKKGEGVHHLCFKVDDITQALERIKRKNVKLIDEVPRTGASGKAIAFIHPKDMGGILIELTEADDVDTGDRNDK